MPRINNRLNTLLRWTRRLCHKLSLQWVKEVQRIANRFCVEIATGQASDNWQVRGESTAQQWIPMEGGKSREPHPALTALKKLDARVAPWGIGPSNMERFIPRIRKPKSNANTIH